MHFNVSDLIFVSAEHPQKLLKLMETEGAQYIWKSGHFYLGA